MTSYYTSLYFVRNHLLYKQIIVLFFVLIMGKISVIDKMRIQTLRELGRRYKAITNKYSHKQWNLRSVKNIRKRVDLDQRGSATQRKPGSHNIESVADLLCSQEDQPGSTIMFGAGWRVMLDKFNRLNAQPKNMRELKTTLLVIWDELPQEAIRKSIASFRKCLRACIIAKGGHTVKRSSELRLLSD